MKYSTAIGIDTHGKTNTICVLDPDTGAMIETTLSGDPGDVAEWINKQRFPLPIMAAYESGPTGFVLARVLVAAGIPCKIAAVSKLAKNPNEKKNDKEDARKLARRIVSGEIYAVWIPSPEQEAGCNLSRLRGEAATDLRRAKQRATSFLLKMGIRYTDGKRWTQKFRKWAKALEFEKELDTYVFREKLADVYAQEQRLVSIEQRLHEFIDVDLELKALVARLMCIHGIGFVIASALVLEVGDFTRFKNGQSLASYLGLVPTENSSGEKDVKGKITKAGNGHLRRLMVEGASAYSRRSRLDVPSDPTVDSLVRIHAHKGSKRLYKRRNALAKRKKQHNKAKVAIAREMAEWVYYIATM